MLVSIMMPVYNGEKTIGRAIRSLINQTYGNFECIVVDDGSTDKTLEVVRSFIDPRIKLIVLPENKGRPYARQVALNAAKGQFLAMLDADDWYYSNKLETQLAAFEKNPEIIAVSGAMLTTKGEEPIGVRGKGSGQVEALTCPLDLSFPHGPAMIKMSEAKKYRYNMKLKQGQDTDYLMRVLHRKKYIKLDSVLYCYSEWDSVDAKKVLYGYFLQYRRDSQWLRKFPLKTIKKHIDVTLKIISVSVLSLLGMFKFYFRRRSNELTEKDIQEYRKELKDLKLLL